MKTLDLTAPRPFDDAAFYVPKDPRVEAVLGTAASQANRRSRGEGPPWCIFAGKVHYTGLALNNHIADQVAAGIAEHERRSGDRPAA